MAYQITLRKSVIKTLEEVNEPYFSKIKKAIYGLAENPRPNGYIKLKGRNGYRIRVADDRIIYEISDELQSVEILAIGHRKDIYK
ncbi:MAG: type II toxin-antitoxin system RelE/ParE family toxin [Chitinophagaceae bacterium]|nr:type II toxin-antitoxin system RelE/ParE family toxin [Chitinophagaceae bacterium]